MQLIDCEEKERTVQGVSGWRRCVIYADLASQMASEGRCADKGSEGERLMQMMREDGVQIGSFNAETLGRYVSLGRRCKDRTILTTLQSWEALCKRDMLLDAVTTVRHVFGSTDDNDTLARILRTLMMEQRAGLRTKLETPRSRNEPRHPTNIAKGIVLRNQLLDFLGVSFPKLSEDMQSYCSWKYMQNFFGIDEHGIKVSEATEVVESDEEMESADQISVYRSRPILMPSWLKHLWTAQYEKLDVML